MIKTYKHFNKATEFLLGLSFKALIQITLILLPIIWLAIQLKLSLNSPFLLFLGIVSMIIIAFIIKSSRDSTVQGFYSSFLFHPFENHIYSLGKDDQAYKSIETLLDISSVNKEYVISKDSDLISIIKLNNGISFHRYSKEERKALLEKWGAFLSKISSINNLNSYLWTSPNGGDSVQLFTVIDNYHNPDYRSSQFIPDENFYIIIREKNPENNLPKLFKLIKNHLFKKKELDLSELRNRLEEKTQTLVNTLKSIEIDSLRLKNGELKTFIKEWFPLKQDYSIEDKAKYLEHHQGSEKFFTKTYRLNICPEAGELDFWIKDYIKNLKHKSTISLQLTARDANKDRREAENKSNIFNQMNRSNSSYKNSVIKESQIIADELINKPYSFDLSLFITIYTKSPIELQKTDNLIKQPIKASELSGLERQQVKNWVYSLPIAHNELKQEDKLFSNLDFARACFPFIKSPSGTKAGPLLGINLENKRPIFLNEYDRSLCNNRGINFIGDSGSGKTVAAKLSVKRRLESDPEKSFYIIDNTADGWKFFIDYFSGEIIELDNPRLKEDEALFSPFSISQEEYQSSQDFNNQLETCLSLFEIIANRPLSSSDKAYLTGILKNSYTQTLDLRFSEIIKALETDSDPRKDLWIEIFSPYSLSQEGIYGNLMDSKQSKAFNNRLILFTFSKIKTDPTYQNLCLKLLTNFIERKIIYEKQTKTTLVLDEAWKIFQNQQAPQGKELLTHLARAGRGLDLGLWTISQKPTDLPSEIHSSASLSLCFQLKEKGDRLDMMRFANLNESEKELIDSYEIRDSGVCLFKTTRSSDLIKIEMDSLEEALTNSTRDFSNRRQELTEKLISLGLGRHEASRKAIAVILSEIRHYEEQRDVAIH